jgi:hypothetical protein
MEKLSLEEINQGLSEDAPRLHFLGFDLSALLGEGNLIASQKVMLAKENTYLEERKSAITNLCTISLSH